MGVDPLTALAAGTVISGVVGANQTRKASRGARKALSQAPGKALGYAETLLDEFGRPMYGESEFYGVGPEGAEAKGQAIYERQLALLQPQLEDEKRRIEQRMLAQGLPSSLVTEALREVEDKYAQAAQQAAFAGTIAGVDLEAQEAARRTQYGLISSERDFLEGQYPIGLAAGLVPSFLGQAQGVGNAGFMGAQMSQDVAAGVGAGLGSLYTNYQNYNLSNRYLGLLAGQATNPSVTFAPTGSSYFKDLSSDPLKSGKFDALYKGD